MCVSLLHMPSNTPWLGRLSYVYSLCLCFEACGCWTMGASRLQTLSMVLILRLKVTLSVLMLACHDLFVGLVQGQQAKGHHAYKQLMIFCLSGSTVVNRLALTLSVSRS